MTIRYNIDGKERVHVESYVLYEWVEEVQEVTLKGYKLCLENDRFPHSYVGYYSAYFDKVNDALTTEDKDWLDADLAPLLVPLPLPEEVVQKLIDETPIVLTDEDEKKILAEEIAAKNAEDAQEQASSPAEQVNNQDAGTATDVGAFPLREAEPAPQPERPARRGRPPRNAQ